MLILRDEYSADLLKYRIGNAISSLSQQSVGRESFKFLACIDLFISQTGKVDSRCFFYSCFVKENSISDGTFAIHFAWIGTIR